MPKNESVRFARATTCGLAGLLLGGPVVAVVAIALLPFLLTTFRVLSSPANAGAQERFYRGTTPANAVDPAMTGDLRRMITRTERELVASVSGSRD